MILTVAQGALGVASGSLVGFSLGLVGGGGSILAVPLLVMVVGVADPHLAIGTSAVAVAVNAAWSLLTHARLGTVKWRCAMLFAAAGVLGALGGAALGRLMDGPKLLALFAVLMIVVGGLMLRGRGGGEDPGVRLSRANAAPLAGLGLAAGGVSGFFGIGGGFLIVPALVAATGMPALNAVGSSLVAVTAFGAATAGSYATAGLVDPVLAALLVAGGAIGSVLGARAARALGRHKGLLNRVLAGIIVTVGIAMLVRTLAIGA